MKRKSRNKNTVKIKHLIYRRIKLYLRRNKGMIIKFLLTTIVLITMLFSIPFIQENYENNDLIRENVIYLLEEKEQQLVPIDIEDGIISLPDDKEERIQLVLDLLKSGHPKSALAPTIPKDIYIYYFSVDYQHVTINFDGGLNRLSGIKLAYLRSSIIRSLTSLKDIESIEFFSNGIPLKSDKQLVYGRLYKEDVMLSYDEVASSEVFKTVTFYYPNASKSKLRQSNDTILIESNKKLEQIIVETFLHGDKGNIFPLNTKLLNIYTNDGTCFVDLSKECQLNLLPQGISETIAVYSLVNSLSDLPNITEVQFLVEGQLEKTFQGNLEFNKMFKKNYTIME